MNNELLEKYNIEDNENSYVQKLINKNELVGCLLI
jgi:hypothetical protein